MAGSADAGPSLGTNRDLALRLAHWGPNRLRVGAHENYSGTTANFLCSEEPNPRQNARNGFLDPLTIEQN